MVALGRAWLALGISKSPRNPRPGALVIVGISLGGLSALHSPLDRPEAVASVVGVDVAGGSMSKAACRSGTIKRSATTVHYASERARLTALRRFGAFAETPPTAEW